MSEVLDEPLLINTGDTDHPVPVGQAILDGYAPGNELYNFEAFPELTAEELAQLQYTDYQTVFYAVTKKLLGNAIPDEVLRTTAREAYGEDKFDLDDDGNLRFTLLPSGVYMVGLSDGPTGAFKDMAMQPFARWMSYLQQQKADPLTILLSTSGDTGPAALNAFSGLANTEIINMLPENGVSRLQWSQMAEMADHPGVHVLEVPGNFGDLNEIHMEADKRYDLSTANSVNIARIIAQVPYYVASYLKAVSWENKAIGDPVDVSIPSGNFGNALSAIIARKMGLPLRNIIVAANENNILDTLFAEGVLRPTAFQHTDSSAQDIRMPSNIWRYFGMLFGNDPEKVGRIFQHYKATGRAVLSNIGAVDAGLLQGIRSTTVTGPERAATIRRVYDLSDPRRRIIIDPHTANGVAAIDKLQAQDPDVPMLTMETAKPFKFNEAMSRILGIVPPRPERFKDLEARQAETILTHIANADELLAYLKDHTNAKPKPLAS